MENQHHHTKDRSIFFPLAMIAAGVLWILISMGRIPVENLWALAYFWPALLIAAGLGLILRTYRSWAGMLIDFLVIGGAVLAIVFAPQLGWTTPQWGFGVGMNFMGSVRGSGEVVSRTREVEAFEAISIDYPADVIIQQGRSELVKIEADDNLLTQLGTQVNDGTLYIENQESRWSRRVNPSKPVHITITVRSLSRLSFSSAGSVRIVGLEVDDLDVRISGAGRLEIEDLDALSLTCQLTGAGSITASGIVDSLDLQISGLGNFDGKDLLSDTVDVRLSGLGGAVVHPTEQLDARVSGVGSVRYYGNPQVSKQVSGLGSVEPADR